MTTQVTQQECQVMVTTGTGWDMEQMITSAGHADHPGGGRVSERSPAQLTWHLDVSGGEPFLCLYQGGDLRSTKRRSGCIVIMMWILYQDQV